jgi:uncharacterized protein (TIGR03435 family)
MRPSWRGAALLPSFLACALLFAQSPKQFDVVSVRPSPPDADTDTRRLPGGRLMATGLTVKGLIRLGWDLQDFQILGGPAWVSTDRYDIAGRAPDGTSSGESLNPFIQSMLAERFGLKFHLESRQLPRLALTVGKNGHKLRPAQPGAATTWTIRRGVITGRNVTTANLAVNMLQRSLDLWVSDETGIAGQFDIDLKWSPDDDADTPSGPSLFTAIQEQLGLKLVPARGPVPVLVIDNVNRPSEN